MENEIIILQEHLEKRKNFNKSVSDEFKVHKQKNKIEQISELFNCFIQSDVAQEILNNYNNYEEKKYKEKSVDKEEINDDICINNKYYQKCKEVELEMKRIKSLNKEHIEFLLVSLLTIVFSLIGLLIFAIKGLYIIHPSIYILGIFMGIGWGATALTSLYTIGRK